MKKQRKRKDPSSREDLLSLALKLTGAVYARIVVLIELGGAKEPGSTQFIACAREIERGGHVLAMLSQACRRTQLRTAVNAAMGFLEVGKPVPPVLRSMLH